MEWNTLLLDLLQVKMCVIDHISKINLISLVQYTLIMVVDLLCNIQEEQCSWVVCFLPQMEKPPSSYPVVLYRSINFIINTINLYMYSSLPVFTIFLYISSKLRGFRTKPSFRGSLSGDQEAGADLCKMTTSPGVLFDLFYAGGVCRWSHEDSAAAAVV